MTCDFPEGTLRLQLLRDNSRAANGLTHMSHMCFYNRTNEYKESSFIKSGKAEGVSMYQGSHPSITLRSL